MSTISSINTITTPLSDVGSTFSSGASDSTNTEDANAKIAASFDQALTLFLTQLQYQDPLEPLDTGEMTAATSHITEVEQSIRTNELLESIQTALVGSSINQSAEYIDKVVKFDGVNFTLENGTSEFSYVVDEDYAATAITLLDSDNNVVLLFEGQVNEGEHIVSWDGTDAEGNALAEGVYRVSAQGLDQEGNTTPLQTYGTGRVTTVSFDSQNTILEIFGIRLLEDEIMSISSSDRFLETQDES